MKNHAAARGNLRDHSARSASIGSIAAARSAWRRTGSRRCRTQSRSSKLGDENTMRVVLTGLTGRGRHTKSLENSRLAANSQAPKLPETHSRDDAEKGDRSHPPASYDPGRGAGGQVAPPHPSPRWGSFV